MANFDIFLSHNSRDKPAVERIATKLKQAGLEPWLDKWCLTPGGKWQEELAAGLRASLACGFFIGPNGVGDWASEELNVALDRAAKDRIFRLFLVLLPAVPEPFDATSLPPFLSTRTWIDLRKGIEDSRGFQLLINAIKGVAPGPETPIEARADICPYRGLQTFNEEHVQFFFGRNGDIQRLVEKLKATRFFAVLGPSGSGKSSVVRAGLIPRIRAGALPDSDTWAVRVLTPGSHPLTALAAHLLRLFPQDTMQKTLDQMTTDPRTLHLACSLALAERPPSELVIWVIDQFEEVFTLCRDEQELKQFLDNLLYAASIPDGRSMVVLTMRADFYSRCAAYPALSALIASQQFLVSPMDLDGLRQAIEEPAWRVGLEFEEGLVATVLDDVAHEPGALPLLEHALLELWERRRGRMMTLEAYRETGGVHGALAKRADTVYDAFSPEQREIVRRIMLRLTAPGEGTEDTRRRATITELVTSPGEAEAVETVVRAMADARLLTAGADEQSGERLVDVSHEALIRSWPRLRKWIDEDRASLRLLRRITEAAQEWQRLNRDEGGLYRGARLAQALEWREHHEAMLNELEREFLDASVTERNREQEERRLQQERELDAALKLARAETERAEEAEKRATEQKEASNKLRRRAIAVGAAAVTALILFVLSAVEWGREVTAHTDAEHSKRDAELQLATSLIAQGDALGLANQWGQAKERYTTASKQLAKLRSDTFPAQLGLWNAYEYSPPELLSVAADSEQVSGVAIAPDGRAVISAGHDGKLKLWDLSTGTLIRAFPTNSGSALCVAFSNDGKKILSGGADGTATLWDAETGNKIRDLVRIQNGARYQGAVRCIAYSSDAQLGLAGYDDGQIALWHLEDGHLLRVFSGHTAAVRGVAFSPDERLVASGADSPDNSARLWDADTGREISSFHKTNYSDPVFSVAFSPDGHDLLTSGDHSLQLWDVQSHQLLRTFSGHRGAVTSVSFSRDGSLALSASIDRTVRVWDVATAEQRALFSGHGDSVLSAALSLNRALAVSADKGLLKIWSTTPNEVLVMQGHSGALESVAFSPDGLVAVSGSRDNTLRFWDLATGQMLRSIAAHVHMIRSVAYAPDGRFVLSGGYGGAVELWDVATGQLVRTFGSNGQYVESVALSCDGRLAISGGEDNTAHVWEVSTGREVAVFPGHDGDSGVFSVAFSPDATLALSGYRSGVIRLWDVKSAHEIRKFIGHEFIVRSLAFSSDGQTFLSAGWLLVGSDTTLLKFWDVNTGQELRKFGTQQSESYFSVAFSPSNGAVAISASSDGLKLWDVNTGNQIRNFERHRAAVGAAAFSPNGDAWLSGSGDRTVMFWDFSRMRHYEELTPSAFDAVKRLQINPDDPEASVALGKWYAFRGINDQAVELLTKARARGAIVPSLLIARCQWKLHALREARAESQKARDAHEAPNLYIDLCLNAIPNQ